MCPLFREGPIVLEFGAQLARFVGRRVRIYTLDDKVIVGTLQNEPMIYHGLTDHGALTHRGVAVVRPEGASEPVLCPLENVRTFDVLPGSARAISR
jgi:hypothetical protein